MDVALAAYRLRVAQQAGHGLDRLQQVLLGLRRGVRGQLAQGSCGQHRPRPRAEVFRGEVLARDLSQVLVHVRRVDDLPGAGLVDVLKQLEPGEVPASLDDRGELAVAQIYRMRLAALPAELEADSGAI